MSCRRTGGKLGTFWFYEGGTLGFRTMHLYLPDSGVIMAIGLNSCVTPGSSDEIAALAVSVYDTLLSSGVIARRWRRSAWFGADSKLRYTSPGTLPSTGIAGAKSGC